MRTFDIKHSIHRAVSPYIVQTRPTENWGSLAAYKSYAEAHEHIVEIMEKYPALPVRLVIHRRTLKPGDIIQMRRTIRPYLHKRSLYRVDRLLDDGTVVLENDVYLFGPSAVQNLREGVSWVMYREAGQ